MTLTIAIYDEKNFFTKDIDTLKKK